MDINTIDFDMVAGNDVDFSFKLFDENSQQPINLTDINGTIKIQLTEFKKSNVILFEKYCEIYDFKIHLSGNDTNYLSGFYVLSMNAEITNQNNFQYSIKNEYLWLIMSRL